MKRAAYMYFCRQVKCSVLFLVLSLSSLSAAFAQEGLSVRVLERVPILDQGRVKPLDTYAQNVLLQLSGRRSYGGQSAISWLSKLFFEEEKLRSDKIFLINNHEIPLALGILPDPKRRYSFSQLEKGYHKLYELAMAASQVDEKEQTVVEKELLRVYENALLYLQLSSSLRFALAHPDFSVAEPETLKLLDVPAGHFLCFLDVALKADRLRQIAEPLEKKDAGEWTASEREIFRLMSNLFQWSQFYSDPMLRIIPPGEPSVAAWLSPWEALTAQFQNPEIREELKNLRQAALAYERHDQKEFDTAVSAFLASVKKRTVSVRQARVVDWEVFYNRAGLLAKAHLLYALALLAVVVFLVNSKSFFYTGSLWLAIAGLFFHTAAIGLRIFILARPPVSSLYETFVFVGFVCVFLGVFIEMLTRRQLGVLTAAICGVILLMIAGKFSTDGDTMRMLVAVLNSNFWLSTHVLTITMGYAACCVSGVLGHIFLIQMMKKEKETVLRTTYRAVLGTLGLGLTLSFLGTTLGGIWADQSWGRFWGWDPKENGALMIILWTSILFHAKVGRLLSPLGVAVGSVLGLIVVMWAWFGVNLLSVGLHSYGFTEGVALNLLIYVAVQVIFVVTALMFIHFKRQSLVRVVKAWL